MCLYSTEYNSALPYQDSSGANTGEKPEEVLSSSSPEHQQTRRKRSQECSQKHYFQHKVLLKGTKYLGCRSLGPSELANPAAGVSPLPSVKHDPWPAARQGWPGDSLAGTPEGALAQMWNRAHHSAKTPWVLAGQVLFLIPQKWTQFLPIPGESMSFQSQKREESESTGPHLRTLKEQERSPQVVVDLRGRDFFFKLRGCKSTSLTSFGSISCATMSLPSTFTAFFFF